MKQEKLDNIEEEIIEINNAQSAMPFSEEVLVVQKMLNQIKIDDILLEENGLYNKETKQAIMKLQEITDFAQNGIIDQNLMFRLKEIIENPVTTEYNKNKTFAVLYHNYKDK